MTEKIGRNSMGTSTDRYKTGIQLVAKAPWHLVVPKEEARKVAWLQKVESNQMRNRSRRHQDNNI